MNAVVEINVRGARFVALDKAARARAIEGVRGFVVDCRIRLYLDDDPGAFAPNQFSADQFARTGKRIALEERRADNLVHQPTPTLFPLRSRPVKPTACSKPEFSRWIRLVC